MNRPACEHICSSGCLRPLAARHGFMFSGAIPQALSHYSSRPRPGELARWVSRSASRPELPRPSITSGPAEGNSRNRLGSHARKRKAEWKRQQEGQTFVDHTFVTITAGKGGDGCAAFYREKFRPNGPPAGGNGSRGGSVYIRAVSHLTSLSSIPSRVRAPDGRNGRGGFMNGAKVPDTFIDVPVGTVVREVVQPTKNQEEEHASANEKDEVMKGADEQERESQERDQMWVHYPGYHEQNEGSAAFMQAEQALLRQRRAMRREEDRACRDSEPLSLDLDVAHNLPLRPAASPATRTAISGDGNDRRDVDKSYYDRPPTVGPTLLVSGGLGGFGNAYFANGTNRSPKYASRGLPGQRIMLELELKLLADIGLVGLPNAGKSTVLSALTRAKARVAPYAFTTLNPQVGYVRVWDDGRFDMGDGGKESDVVVDDSPARTHVGDGYVEASVLSGDRLPSVDLDHNPNLQANELERMEAMRFTIADNPGLLAGASDNIGLGHSFLRSIERSLALVYVVDFSKEAPWEDVETLRAELETYKPGLSQKARVILANKADLAVSSSSSPFLSHGKVMEEEIQAAQAKLQRLMFYASEMVSHGHDTEQDSTTTTGLESMSHANESDAGFLAQSLVKVIPISAKYRQNLGKVVQVLASLVHEAREKRKPGVEYTP